jgi:hypothetical protein
LSDKLAAEQGGSGSRALGSDGGPTTPEPRPDTQRFFGGLIQSLVTNVIPKVAPHILNLLQQRRRELGLPEQRDAEAVERDFQSILNAILPKLLDAVPGIVNAIAGQPAPRSTEEESERFLPILAGVIPAIIGAVPQIVSMFNRQRGTDPTPPPISDADVAQRFIGPLLSSIVPQLLQAAPSILGAVFGGRRDVPPSSSW